MHLTRYTDYSLRVLIFLALQDADRLVTINDIASHFDIPRNHLIKIVHQLGKGGYLFTVRGRNGGLRLGRPAAEIVLGEVVRYAEPTLDLVDCNEPACPLTAGCRLKTILNEARDAFLDTLDQHTLADLMQKPRQLQSLLHWHPTKGHSAH